MIWNKCSENRMECEWNSIENNNMIPHSIGDNVPILTHDDPIHKKQNSDSIQICLNK